MISKPVIGASSCLLGNEVRFDGGHKRHRFVTDVLAKHMSIKPVCPEMAIGLSTPRPAIRLQAINGEARLVMSKDNDIDLTDTMQAYAEKTLYQFAELDGFIFKKGSPSCGAWRVPVVVHKDGHKRNDGSGIFAQAFMKRFPWIPVEEEGRLNDADLRQNFIERVYALHRWHNIENADNNIQAFIEFHASHKLMLMARSPADYQKLGQFVAQTTQQTLKVRRHEYLLLFMQAMRKPNSRGKHVNVLMHIMGYLKEHLNSSDKAELLAHFEAYRKNQLPWISLIVLLKHHLRKHPAPYINQQYYLNPCPEEIAA
jgi:uncharacterized protein YbgA (DUF1722 family)/uncharacterized protein YbbK (DUF523 family)